jgi:hypothetical protein
MLNRLAGRCGSKDDGLRSEQHTSSAAVPRLRYQQLYRTVESSFYAAEFFMVIPVVDGGFGGSDGFGHGQS